MRFDDNDDFKKLYREAYDDQESTGGIPEELLGDYLDKTSKRKPKIEVIGNTNREYLAFIIGGLSAIKMSDSKKTMILHSIATRLNISHKDASKLLKTLMTNNNKHYEDNKK